jgi:hypothetical protein
VEYFDLLKWHDQRHSLSDVLDLSFTDGPQIIFSSLNKGASKIDKLM